MISKGLKYSSVLIAGLALASGCSGGTATLPPKQVNPGLNGVIQQKPDGRVVSAGELALQSASVTAIAAGDGSVRGRQTTDANGRFSFDNLANGAYLLRVAFDGSIDLDGNGSTDDVDVLMPVTTQGSSSTLAMTFTAVDSDKDGDQDALDVDTRLHSDGSLRLESSKRIDFRRQRVYVDLNANGSFEDGEGQFDLNLDGIADLNDGGGSGSEPRGGVKHGQITAITSSAIEIDGISFGLTGATDWTLADGSAGSQGQFTVGSAAVVHALWNGGAWLATEVELSGSSGTGGSGTERSFSGMISAHSATALSVWNNDFELTAQTRFHADGSLTSDRALFDVGDTVLVRARFDGTDWVALDVHLTANLVADGGGSSNPVMGSFSGQIESRGNSQLQVKGRRFELNGSTQWYVDGTLTTDLTLFDPGDEVRVDARFAGEVWAATSVRLVGNNVSDEPGNTRQVVRGNIALHTATRLRVGGQNFALTAQTQWMAGGSVTTDRSLFDLGDEVSIEANAEGDTVTALSVTLTKNRIPDSGGAITSTFSGEIEAISATSLTIDGESITLNSDTRWMIDGMLTTGLELFRAGDSVEVLAMQSGSLWIALSVSRGSDGGGLGGIL